MRNVKLTGLVGFGVLGLFSACDGKIRDLGRDLSVGGAAMPTGGFSGFTTGGKNSGTPTGGRNYGTGGSGIFNFGTGGMLNTGGLPGTGGEVYATGGGTGLTGLDSSIYPQNPTVPVDPTCTCSDASKICNAAKQCVSRCDSSGACAKWLTNRGIADLFLDGTTLYYTTAPKSDALGNPGNDGSLYCVEYPNGEPLLVAAALGNARVILGRYEGATFLYSAVSQQPGIYRVTDAGVVTQVASLQLSNAVGTMRGAWILYVDATKLYAINLASSLSPQLLVEVPKVDSSLDITIVNPQILDDYFWYGTASGEWCSIPKLSTAGGATCTPGPTGMSVYNILGSAANEVFVDSMGGLVRAADIAGKSLRFLYTGELASSSFYDAGWLYSREYSPSTIRLVRYPTTVGHLPQEVLSYLIATPSLNQGGPFQVNANGIFWSQPLDDMNNNQYIFHAPLPPQPCEASLPCANTAQVCKNGLCSAP